MSSSLQRITGLLLYLASLAALASCTALAQALSGQLDASVVFDAAASCIRMDTEIAVEWMSSGWSVSSTTVLADGAWTKQAVQASLEQSGFELESTASFEPHKRRFKEWKTKASWEDSDGRTKAEVKIGRTTKWITLSLDRDVASSSVDASLRLRSPSGPCSFSFYDAHAGAEGHLCGLEVEMAVDFDSDGFASASVEIHDVDIPAFPDTHLDFEVERTIDAWTVSIDPDVDWQAGGCLDLDVTVALPSGVPANQLVISEVGLAYSLPTMSLEARAILDPSSLPKDDVWLTVAGDATVDASSCVPVDLGWCVRYVAGAGFLPSFALFTVTVHPAPPLDLSLTADVDAIAGLETLTIGACLEW